MGPLQKIALRRVRAAPILGGGALLLAIIVLYRWHGSVAAAWAQAICTLAAVIVALRIASQQGAEAEKRESELRMARARATASRLVSLFVDIEQAIDMAEKMAGLMLESLETSPFFPTELLDRLVLNVVIPDSIYEDFWALQQTTIFQITHTLHGIIHYERASLMMIEAAHADHTRLLATKVPAQALKNLGEMKSEIQKSMDALGPLLEPILPLPRARA